MLLKCSQNSTKTQSKCSQNAVKMQSKCSANAVKMQSKYVQPKHSQNTVKTQLNFSQNAVKIQSLLGVLTGVFSLVLLQNSSILLLKSHFKWLFCLLMHPLIYTSLKKWHKESETKDS